jgi:DNA polymerase
VKCASFEVKPVADESRDDQELIPLVRALRQQLESWSRAGLDRIPAAGRGEGFEAWLARDEAFRPPGAVEASVRPGIPSAAQSQAPMRSAAPAPEAARQTPLSASAPEMKPPALAARPEPKRTLGVPAVGSLFDAPDFETPPVAPCDRAAILAALGAEVSVCPKCPALAATRTQTVFGVGSPTCRLMFVGEAPGADEDRLGEPFVGRAGQLLTDMITKGMGLARADVYIANILKCRPPDNRTPTLEETDNCLPYLERQIAIIRPDFLCMLGLVAAQTLLETTQSLGRLRGRWHRYRGIPTLVTYHPAFLLRSPAFKKQAWEDLQILMKELGLKVPSRSQRNSGDAERA